MDAPQAQTEASHTKIMAQSYNHPTRTEINLAQSQKVPGKTKRDTKYFKNCLFSLLFSKERKKKRTFVRIK